MIWYLGLTLRQLTVIGHVERSTNHNAFWLYSRHILVASPLLTCEVYHYFHYLRPRADHGDGTAAQSNSSFYASLYLKVQLDA